MPNFADCVTKISTGAFISGSKKLPKNIEVNNPSPELTAAVMKNPVVLKLHEIPTKVYRALGVVVPPQNKFIQKLPDGLVAYEKPAVGIKLTPEQEKISKLRW